MHAAHSNGHLSITPEAMHKLLTAHKVGPHFLDLLLSFAVGAKDTEAGVGSLTYKARPDSSFGSLVFFLTCLKAIQSY